VLLVRTMIIIQVQKIGGTVIESGNGISTSNCNNP